MQKQTKKIIEILEEEFPLAKSELSYKNNFELIVAVILSAQCTDKRVNQVTPALFTVADTPKKMAELPIETLEKLIFSCGFYHDKARHLQQMSVDLLNRFNGEVPNNIDALMSLSGVGRKTANVVFAVGFGGQAIAVDTHVFRVSNRLGIVHAKNVLETEKQLMQELPNDRWNVCHHYLLLHGRYVCKSRVPNCKDCKLQEFCEYFTKQTH